MIAISTGFVLAMMLAGVLACTATMWQARAAPQLAFTNTDKTNAHKGAVGLLTLFRYNGGQGSIEPVIRAPSWPGFLPCPYPLHARSAQPVHEGEQGKVNDSYEDDEMEARPRSVEEQVFNDCLDSFDACGGRERALALKVALLSRYPGHRSAVSRAFREIYS